MERPRPTRMARWSDLKRRRSGGAADTREGDVVVLTAPCVRTWPVKTRMVLLLSQCLTLQTIATILKMFCHTMMQWMITYLMIRCAVYSSQLGTVPMFLMGQFLLERDKIVLTNCILIGIDTLFFHVDITMFIDALFFHVDITMVIDMAYAVVLFFGWSEIQIEKNHVDHQLLQVLDWSRVVPQPCHVIRYLDGKICCC